MRGQSPPSSLPCALVQQWIKCQSRETPRFSATSWRKRSPMRDKGYPCPPSVCLYGNKYNAAEIEQHRDIISHISSLEGVPTQTCNYITLKIDSTDAIKIACTTEVNFTILCSWQRYNQYKVTHPVLLPLLPVAEALKNFQERMTEFEQEEIMDYAEIWFMGLGSQKIEGSQGTPQNSGYDDEHGSYIRVMS